MDLNSPPIEKGLDLVTCFQQVEYIKGETVTLYK